MDEGVETDEKKAVDSGEYELYISCHKAYCDQKSRCVSKIQTAREHLYRS